MLFYFIKTIFLLALFYILFKLFIQNKSSYGWNRSYLFFTSLFSIIAPFISLKGLKSNSLFQSFTSHEISQLSQTISSPLHSFETEYAKYIFIVLFMGMLWGITRMAFGLYIIYQLKKNAIIEELNTVKIWFHSSIETPFTFFNLLFLPPTYKAHKNLEIILAHENAHIKLNHSYGKIYYSFLQAIFWFNPFVYFYHHELDLQHELEADEFTIRSIDKNIYLNNYLISANSILAPTLLVHGHFKHDQEIRRVRLDNPISHSFIQKLLLITLVLLIILLGIIF